MLFCKLVQLQQLNRQSEKKQSNTNAVVMLYSQSRTFVQFNLPFIQHPFHTPHPHLKALKGDASLGLQGFVQALKLAPDICEDYRFYCGTSVLTVFILLQHCATQFTSLACIQTMTDKVAGLLSSCRPDKIIL